MQNYRIGLSSQSLPKTGYLNRAHLFNTAACKKPSFLNRCIHMIIHLLATMLFSSYCYGQTPEPTILEAEAFIKQQGIYTELTQDINGGRNVGWTDPGDWITYSLSITQAGQYTITYRVASQSNGGQFQLINELTGEIYDQITVPVTGGWQVWTDVIHTISLPANNDGVRIKITTGGFNLNWIQFSPLPGVIPLPDDSQTDTSSIKSRTYPASTVSGGLGTAACTGAKFCTNESWGVDLNWNTGFHWSIVGDNEAEANVFIKVSVPSGRRAMSLWMNQQLLGIITSDASTNPRPTGKEFGPFAAKQIQGENILELRDTEGTSELDVHYARVETKPVDTQENVYIQIDKAMDYVYLQVNGIEKMRWLKSTINNKVQQNIHDPSLVNLGAKLDITSLLAEGENEVKIVAAADSWYNIVAGYDIRLWQGENLVVNERKNFTRNDNFPGIVFDKTLSISKNTNQRPLKLTIDSDVGGEAIYINNVYTAKRAPATFTVSPGQYTVALGEYLSANNTPQIQPDWWNEKNIKGQYFEQKITVDNKDITLKRSDMPKLPQQSTWRVAVIMYTNMHTVATMSDAQNGISAASDNIAILTEEDIIVAEASVKATANEWLQQMSYGLSNWDITVLPPFTPRSYRTLDRNDDNGLYWEGINISENLTEYDMVIHLMPNRTASRAYIKDNFGGLGGRPNFYLPANWADATGATLQQRLANLRPSPGMLHEALHTYDNSRINDYNGVNQLHGGEEHGYTNASEDCYEWACWYADYIVSQAAEDTTVLSSVNRSEILDSSGNITKQFNPVTESQASTFIGVFNLIRNGSGAEQSLPTSTLRNASNNRCLDVASGSALSGAEVLTWACHGGLNQQWKLKHISNQTYNLMSRNTLKCAVVENKQITQRTCNTSLNSRFRVEHLNTEEFRILSLDGRCMSIDDDNNPTMEDCNESNHKHIWSFE